MLLVVFGLPSVGKSTVAKLLARKVNGIVINTDVIRKKLFKKPTYEKWEKELVYKAIFLLADYLLKANQTVILDAVFPKEEYRKEAIEIAKSNRQKIYFIECRCKEKIIRERLKDRFRKRVVSDANYEIYLKLKKEWEPIKLKHFVIDTSSGTKKAVQKLIEKLKLLGIVKG